jgi:hypothetical protein
VAAEPARHESVPVVAAPRGLELPRVDANATLVVESWAFVAIDRDRTLRVGAVPSTAISEAGLDVAALSRGEVVAKDRLTESVREVLRQRAAQEPPPPPPPRPAPAKKKAKKKQPAGAQMTREEAIEAAREAGILGEEPTYPTCGDPFPMLTGSGDERPRELAPIRATACPIVQPDTTARFAALVIADRETLAAAVIEPFVADHGVLLARFAVVTSAGSHARSLAVQIGQNTRPGTPLPLRPAADRVLVLDGKSGAAPRAFTARDPWIWIKPDATYISMIELIQALSVADTGKITLTLEDPR